MFQNWLHPINVKELFKNKPKDYQLGSRIQFFNEKDNELKNTQIALIGIGEKDANAIRQELYNLSFPFDKLSIADLGNTRKTDEAFIIPLVKELLDSKILPITISSSPAHMLSQFKAFHSLQQLLSMVVVDERLRFDLGANQTDALFLNELVKSRKSRLFHLGLIGCQGHYINPNSIKTLEKRNFECIRLGNAKNNLAELEPIIRDGDLLSFNLAALKQSEAPGQSLATPSGFQVEEACQICRYAGMSDKLKSFGVYGFRSSLDRKKQTAQAVAQMLWYFIDGYYHRTSDFPASTDGLIEYIVEFKKLDYQLTFWKSTKSGRWWMQVPVKNNKKYHRHRLIPCSVNDYKLACQEELPDRLLNALKRFS